MSELCDVAGCARIVRCRGLCNGHYQRLKAHGSTLPDKPLAANRPRGMSEAQIFEHYLPENIEENSCWEWQGVVMKIGYGQVSIHGKPKYSHRLAWELVHGDIPKGMYVRHSCDNRKCVNPKHLSLGTFYDNMQDAIDRRRFKHSEEHWNSKLNRAAVRKIREQAKSGEFHKDIAADYGVSRTVITNIVNRKLWKYVD